jgi:(1->4)-alpha-D-glucan 1-alpha-D-glucosylmutase
MTMPRATYRLQFRGGMDFDRAVTIVPYLKRLGVSHLYASPIFSAVKGSTHGYDVTDHQKIDPTLGGREGFERLSRALKQAGLGLIIDIVPNHMAASLENRWWCDVVEWGSQSRFHRHFDVDWRERLTLPILGKPVEEAIAGGELKLRLDRAAGGLALGYFETLLPLTPKSYADVLSRCDGPLAAELARCAEGATPDTSDAMHIRMRGLLSDEKASKALEESLANVSVDPAFVEAVHAAQPWRLVFWKEARRHLSYRRFFEVTGLVGVRVEERAVFDDVHRLIFELVRNGTVDGLRVDHVDGLADPAGYLALLRQEAGPDVHIVVEKILARDETLPADWPIVGTTGYEFIATMGDLLVNAGGASELERRFGLLGGPEMEDERRRAKRLMATVNFATEVAGLVDLAGRSRSRAEPQDMRAAIVELVVAFPVYRTYGTDIGLSDGDRLLLQQAGREASARLAAPREQEALDLVLAILRGDDGEAGADEFRRRFQQLTGPIMAKSVEDTLFYRCNHMIALNEVGCDPAHLDASSVHVHDALAAGTRSPFSLLGTATHDTKRGEDARARLYALSEAPAQWAEAVERWRDMHSGLVRQLGDRPTPEPTVEWLLYQSLAGVWPAGTSSLDAEAAKALLGRFEAYVEKALREAKQRTSWSEVDEAYEATVKAYAAALLGPDNARFHEDFSRVVRPFAAAGLVNGLSQTLIKMTAPGIPDIYQGSEVEDFSLVDPDNRRPIDFARMALMLPSSDAVFSAEDVRRGTAKHGLIARCLAHRAAHVEIYARGDYLPLSVSGARRENVFAFARRHVDQAIVVVVPRLILGSIANDSPWPNADFWADTSIELPEGLRSRPLAGVLEGTSCVPSERLGVAALLGSFPVALLSTL